MKVSVVVPTMNGEEGFARAVAMIPSSFGDLDHEVIVVDNGAPFNAVDSALQSASVVAKVLRNDVNIGYAPACNQGAALASGEYILLLNSDCFLPVSSMKSLVEIADVDESGAGWQPLILSEDGSRVDSAGSAFTYTGFLWHDTDYPAAGETTRSIFAAKGACFLVRKSVYESIGGFPDEFFAYFEDTDLCWKMRMSGWNVRLVPTIAVRHGIGKTTSRYFSAEEIDYMSFRNRIHSILMNASGRSLLRILPVHLAACLATAVLFFVRGKPQSSGAIIRAIVWPLCNVSHARETRRNAQSQRSCADSFVFGRDVSAFMTFGRAVELLRAYLPRW